MTRLLNLLGYPCLDLCMVFASFFFILLTFPHLILPSCLPLISLYVINRAARNWRENQRVDPDGKHVLITGCDTGFGFHLARVLDRRGFHVIATCLVEQGEGYKELERSGSSRMHVLQLDVSSQDSVDACLEKVTRICGVKGLWAVVNNAATAVNLDVEVLDMETFHRIIDVNVFGTVRVCKAFLPLIRKRKGRVLNVTSVRALIGVQSSSAYVASKYAGEGFSESLRREMEPFGVKVIIIRPGMYGLETGQFLPENVERIRATMTRILDRVDPEVKSAYGETYLETFPARIPRARLSGEEPIRRVLDAFESAVSCVHPQTSYLIDTVHRRLDTDCLCARLTGIMPSYVIDRLRLHFFPIRKEAFITITNKN